MKKYWPLFVEWFEARNERERVLITIVSVVAIVSCWLVLLSDPLSAGRQQLETQRDNLQKQEVALQAQIDAIVARSKLDPNEANKAKMDRIQDEIEDLNERLREKMKGFVDPSRMATLLEDVLKQNTHMRLVRLESLPAEFVLAELEKKTSDSAEHGLYRHAFKMELQGSYLHTLTYLKALEALPWDFYWDAIDVEVIKYPQAKIIIQLHTLSLKEGWIGV